MSKELIVSTGKHETRVAILEDDQLVEIFHEREKEYSLAGSIHKGRVTRVLPGMQSAFVDIGLERDAFLYVSDFFEDNDEYDAVVTTVEDKVLKLDKVAEPARQLSAPVEASVTAPSAAPAQMARPVMDRPSGERPANAERSGNERAGGERAGGERSANDRSANDRSGNDKGGRGRRGQRRRGGRPDSGGLPESKFYTPGSDEQDSEAEDAGSETAEPTVAAAPSSRVADDFMVLPGETLAKYSAPESDPEPETHRPEIQVQDAQPAEAHTAEAHTAEAPGSEAPTAEAHAHELHHVEETEVGGHLEASPEPEPEIEAEADEEFEASLPAEHPLAGLSAIPFWETETVTAEFAVVTSVSEPEAETLLAEALLSEALTDEEEFDSEPLADTESEEPGNGSEPALAEDEGPEPARIPTSLTATLREQGHRYPHRVSRRMRRKMRGGQPEERGTQNGTPAEDSAEVKTVALAPVEERRPEERRPEERRPEERRPDGRHDRGGRERSDRPQRGDRPDRNSERSSERNSERNSERTSERSAEPRSERPERERPPLPSISDLLKEGQEIIVQIAKEPLGQKGARITSHIALPGRFVVYMPTVDHAGVSRKIPSDEERQRLKRIVQTHRQGIPGGFICRTAAENKSEEELRHDMHFLYNLWLDMRQKAEKKPAPVLLHHDLDLVQRILRDQLTTSFKTIWVDGEELFESILRFVQRFQPLLVGRVKLYTRPNPIFDEFGITAELEKALRPKVWLKSGGYIVINQTEALVAIDINTGKYVGKSNRLEDTIVKINTDAIKEIVRQIRLRDLGGIIVVDFIDMDERKNRQKVMQVLEETMRADRAPYKILQFNDFGLVAITRKRVKQSLERTLCAPCPYCEGAGYVKSAQTVIGEILQEAQRMQKALLDPHNNIVLRVNPEVGKILKSNQNQFLQEIEEILGKSVMVKSDPLLHQTKFDLA